MTFDTAGNLKDQLTVSFGIHRCGNITDGVVISEHDEGKYAAGFVIAFADLERWYLAAKAYRGPEIGNEVQK